MSEQLHNVQLVDFQKRKPYKLVIDGRGNPIRGLYEDDKGNFWERGSMGNERGFD